MTLMLIGILCCILSSIQDISISISSNHKSLEQRITMLDMHDLALAASRYFYTGDKLFTVLASIKNSPASRTSLNFKEQIFKKKE